MQKHIIYIATNANRMHLEAGYCQDIIYKYFELQESRNSIFNATVMLNRIVHIEEFDSFEDAQKRLAQVNTYTRMQTEKLIRKLNPNWLSLTNGLKNTIPQNEKAVAHA